MICRLELLRFAQYLLQLDHAPVLELDDLSALRTDHVIVMRAPDRFLVLRISFAEAVPRNDAALMQQVQRVIHRRPRDLAAVRLQVKEQGVRLEMSFPFEHAVQHFDPLRRNALPAALNEFYKVLSRILFVHLILIKTKSK